MKRAFAQIHVEWKLYAGLASPSGCEVVAVDGAVMTTADMLHDGRTVDVGWSDVPCATSAIVCATSGIWREWKTLQGKPCALGLGILRRPSTM